MISRVQIRHARQAGALSLALACGLLAGAPRVARAGGFNLSWADCGNNGTASRSFACNSDAGTNVFYLSASPNSPMSQFVAMSAVISVFTPQPTVSPWWHLESPGGCRSRALSANFNFTAGPFSCSDPWGGNAMGGTAWQYFGLDGSARARLRVVCALGTPIMLTPGTEYYMCSFAVNNTSTTGPAACAGCGDPICLVVESVLLSEPAVAGDPSAQNTNSPADETLTDALLRQRITWQGSASAVGGDCAASIVPKQSTWGGLKSLYH